MAARPVVPPAGTGTATRSPFLHRPTASPMAAATWTDRRVLVTNLRTIWGRAYPRVIGLRREPSWLFFEVLLPFLTTSTFVFVYRALQAPPEYIGFVVLGGAMAAFWLNVMWMMAAQLYWEKDTGNLDLYLTTPISLMSVLLGMAIGGLLSTSLRASMVLLIGSVLYGVTFDVHDWVLLLAVFFLTLAALYGLGMVLASLFLLFGREAWHLSNAMQEPVYFVSGLNFPVGRLGILGGLAISLIPLAVGLDAMRQLAFPASAGATGAAPPGIEALLLVGMTVVFVGAARFMLRRMELLARAEGRLSVKGG
ncbi:MAG: ABC transporter permease [Chloroflexota bacterium]